MLPKDEARMVEKFGTRLATVTGFFALIFLLHPPQAQLTLFAMSIEFAILNVVLVVSNFPDCRKLPATNTSPCSAFSHSQMTKRVNVTLFICVFLSKEEGSHPLMIPLP